MMYYEPASVRTGMQEMECIIIFGMTSFESQQSEKHEEKEPFRGIGKEM